MPASDLSICEAIQNQSARGQSAPWQGCIECLSWPAGDGHRWMCVCVWSTSICGANVPLSMRVSSTPQQKALFFSTCLHGPGPMPGTKCYDSKPPTTLSCTVSCSCPSCSRLSCVRPEASALCYTRARFPVLGMLRCPSIIEKQDVGSRYRTKERGSLASASPAMKHRAAAGPLEAVPLISSAGVEVASWWIKKAEAAVLRQLFLSFIFLSSSLLLIFSSTFPYFSLD